VPTIEAFADHPTHPYVRVQATWSDLPQVTQAAVYRVNVRTGECTPLRPYVCFDGWELMLSCGHGTWWDTEVPFDEPVYYITTSSQAPCLPQELFRSTFSRDLVDSWGTTDTGILSPLTYVLSGGVNPGNYDVNGGKGRMSLTTVTTDRTAAIDIGRTDFDLYADFSTNQTATVQDVTCRIMGRFTDNLNSYEGGINFAPDGTVLAFIARIVGGVETILTIAFGIGAYVPDQEWTVRFQGRGNDFKLKAWPSATSIEPLPWLFETTDTPQPTLTSTRVGILSRRDTGNTNVGLITATDNFIGLDACLPCVPVEVDTSGDPITIASDGRFWLKDPVRPCHDRPVPLCPIDGRPTICGGGEGILFIGMGPEIYSANSYSLRPMNRRRTLAITRPRSDATTALRLQTMTFVDRDDLLQLAAPGSPLLFQGPAEYGIPDRYMDVKDVQVSPELPDLRIQIRTEVLPYDTVDRPPGPSQGICGARVADICALYPTWNDLAATGLTWDQLVAGQADPVSNDPNRRTWDDVDADFVNWDAVEAGGRTWQELQEGD
jgi:hypothetical protein